MKHYARIDENNIVVQVIVSNQSDIDASAWGDPERWKWTDFRERGFYAEPGTFADIGYEYLPDHDRFKPPQLDPAWIYNEQKFQWEPTAIWLYVNNK